MIINNISLVAVRLEKEFVQGNESITEFWF